MRTPFAVVVALLVTVAPAAAQFNRTTEVTLADLGAPPDASIRVITVNHETALLEVVPAGPGMVFILIRPTATGFCRESVQILGMGVTDYDISDVNHDGSDDLVMTSSTHGTVALWTNTGWQDCAR